MGRLCLLLLLSGASRPLAAQLLDTTWTRHHAVEHLAGGVAVDLLARGPWIARSFRDTAPKRLAWVLVVEGTYEAVQVWQWHGRYPVRYALLDTGAAVTAASLLELLASQLHQVRRR